MKGTIVPMWATCAAALLACHPRDAPPATAAAPTPFADSVAAAVALLRNDVTLGAWLEAHPEDSLKLFDRPVRQPNAYGPGPFEFADWCARAKHDRRLAYFYPPTFTAGAELPPSAPADHQRVRREGCKLGLLLMTTAESDSARGDTAAVDLQRALQQRFGAAPVGAGGLSRYWSGTLAWQAGGLGFAVAFSRDSGVEYEAEEEGGPEELVRYGDDQRGLVAVTYRLHPGIADREFAHLDEDDEWPQQDAVAVVRLGAAAAGVADTQAIIRLALRLKRFADDKQRHAERKIPNDSLFAVLEAWIAAARALPGPARGAALFAADALLDYGHNQLDAFSFGREADSSARVRLMALGARFTWSHYDIVDYIYTRSWRQEARGLEPGGVVADSLFSAEVEHPGVCASPDTVIQEVTRYLTSPRPVAMQTRAHLALGRAYADKLLGRAPGDAAARAAEHYRAALRLGRGTPLEAVAWREAWRVSAGLLPVRLRFYCSSGD